MRPAATPLPFLRKLRRNGFLLPLRPECAPLAERQPGNFKEILHDVLAVNVGSGSVRVLATPMIVAFMEEAASACVAPYLGEGRTTVGTSIAISHSAPTFFGGAVSVKATLTAVGAGGRSFTFAVEARDNAGLVAQGTHERFAVDKAKFESKAEERLAM